MNTLRMAWWVAGPLVSLGLTGYWSWRIAASVYRFLELRRDV